MLRKITVKNYKSVHDITTELGRMNIFIGENGCGKSNILEALAMAGASKASDLDVEGLYNRGVRVVKPSLTFSSFTRLRQNKKIIIDLEFQEGDEKVNIPTALHCENEEDIYSKWKDEGGILLIDESETHLHSSMLDKISKDATFKIVHKTGIGNKRILTEWLVSDLSGLTNYLIFNLNTKALRGVRSESKKMPLGINGESLDILLSQFTQAEWEQLIRYNYMIRWLDEILIDEKDVFKFKGHKLGRSNSILYFKDRFMQKKDMNNIFSAENANDGVLYVLFYLALFISKKTPSLFAIDNIESSLNPRICRALIKELSHLSDTNNKQVLITTHNPAVLDGINLNDNEQRLFIVDRGEGGKTRVKRIKMKPDADEKLKLSEMWMRGYLGGLPKNF
ncbi:AAA family ATPase [Desulfobacterales bacterium HSG2]|nr:AAA family ATPase [Desulfobacterales bacterium HSG2]MDM8548527.1 AAA family ATPase [Desulfobacterales bacterium HSG2]